MHRCKVVMVAMAVYLIVLGGGIHVQAGSFSDNFDDNSIDSGVWNASTQGGATLSEVNQRLEINFTSTGSSGTMTYNSAISGDFDARVDYELLNWPTNNGVRVFLQRYNNPSGLQASVIRFNQAYSPIMSDAYVTNFNNTLYPDPFISTDATVGSLRFAREGNVFSGYYGTLGDEDTWNLIHSYTYTGDAITVPLQFGASTDIGNPNGTQIAFDNFRVSGPLVTPEPATTTLLLLGSGILGMAGMKRKKCT